MGFIKIPNLPQSRVRVAVIDGRVDEGIEKELKKQGIELVKTSEFKSVYPSISFHPDMVIHHVGGSKIVYAPGTDKAFLGRLREYGFELLEGETVLSKTYPGDIAYNVARIGDFAVHNFRYTDPVIKKELEKAGVEFINVKQGYSKCSICVINENSIITSDRGIAKAVECRGIDALLIEPDENIMLPGLNMGFIGGSTGFVDKCKLAIAGNVESLGSAGKIKEYLKRKGIDIFSLGGGPVVDIGTIIPLLTISNAIDI